MRTLCFAALYLLVGAPGFAQTTGDTPPRLPKDPRAIFEAAAPLYDFTSPELKAWHLKATYQLYDEKGKPSEQGTYEYWWASPKVYRSTWTRAGATRTDWRLKGGGDAYESTGEPISLFEMNLQSAILSPLPSDADLDPAKYSIEQKSVAENGLGGPCLIIVPKIRQPDPRFRPKHGSFPMYCFESQKPALRSAYSNEQGLTQFNRIDQLQGRYIARELSFIEGKHKLLTATIDRIDHITALDPAFETSASATCTKMGLDRAAAGVSLDAKTLNGFLIKKVEPIYPPAAKEALIQGIVVLDASIGTDGKIHNLRVVSAPSPLLANSSFQAVSQWEYKPYELNGSPVPVDTTINVTYALGKNARDR